MSADFLWAYFARLRQLSEEAVAHQECTNTSAAPHWRFPRQTQFRRLFRRKYIDQESSLCAAPRNIPLLKLERLTPESSSENKQICQSQWLHSKIHQYAHQTTEASKSVPTTEKLSLPNDVSNDFMNFTKFVTHLAELR